MVQVPALQVAVVRDRRILRDVRVRPRLVRWQIRTFLGGSGPGRIEKQPRSSSSCPALSQFDLRTTGSRSTPDCRSSKAGQRRPCPSHDPPGRGRRSRSSAPVPTRRVALPGMADLHGVQTVSGSALREHGRDGRERRDAQSNGESCYEAARALGFRADLTTPEPSNALSRCHRSSERSVVGRPAQLRWPIPGLVAATQSSTVELALDVWSQPTRRETSAPRRSYP